MSHKPSMWTREKTERLRELWWQGKSAPAISVMLGARSAKAVREKITREGFKRAPDFAPTSVPPMLNRKFFPASELPELRERDDEPPPLVRADGSIVTLANARDKECRWMRGRPGPFARLCGQPVYGASWCRTHFQRCFPAKVMT